MNARAYTALVVAALLVAALVFYGCPPSRPKEDPSALRTASSATVRIGIFGEDVTVPEDILKLGPLPGVPADLMKASESGIEQLAELSKEGDPRRLGFLKPPDPRGLRALAPFRNATVLLAALKTYEASVDPATVIKTNERLTFPIVAGDKVVSSVTLSRSGSTWTPSAFGNANVIRALMKARMAAVRPQHGDVLVRPGNAAEYTIVEVFGVNELFVSARGLGNELYLIPLNTRPDLGFTAGVPLLARDALLKLRPAAEKHNGLPT